MRYSLGSVPRRCPSAGRTESPRRSRSVSPELAFSLDARTSGRTKGARMQRSLPARPSLAQLRRQAKDLLRGAQAGQIEALDRLRAQHPRLARLSAADLGASGLALHQAQLVLAREYGFASWPKLKLHVESIERVEERVAGLRAAFATAD